MFGAVRRGAPSGLVLLLLFTSGASRKRPMAQGLFRTQARLTGSVQELTECNGTAPSSVFILQNWTQLYNDKGDVLVSGMVLITKALQYMTRGHAIFTKCTEEGTNCEPILTLRVGRNACDMWAKQNVFWTPLVNNIWKADSPHPKRPHCPVEKGYWHGNNVTFDLDSAARLCPFPLTNSVWTIRAEGWDQDDAYWFCLFMRAKLIRYGSRREHHHD